jgi:hypothetical protein
LGYKGSTTIGDPCLALHARFCYAGLRLDYELNDELPELKILQTAIQEGCGFCHLLYGAIRRHVSGRKQKITVNLNITSQSRIRGTEDDHYTEFGISCITAWLKLEFSTFHFLCHKFCLIDMTAGFLMLRFDLSSSPGKIRSLSIPVDMQVTMAHH